MHNDKVKVSVIVPVYRVEKTLDRCLESIVNQTYNNLEIILVDDGSPDQCPQMCDEWALKDPRIKVIHKKNGGLSSARNAGLKIYTGDYVSFVDSDDYLDLQAYESLVGYATKNNADLVLNNYYDVNSTNSQKIVALSSESTNKDLVKLTLLGKAPTSAWGRFIARDILENQGIIRFEEGRQYEDTIPAFKALLKSKNAVYLGTPLNYYVQSNGSIVANPKYSDVEDLYHNVKVIGEMFVGTQYENLFANYGIKTLIYALQLFYRMHIQGGEIEEKILLEIKRYLPKLKYSNIFCDRGAKKLLLAKWRMIVPAIKIREK